jgi:S-DNA-T family DNA segregation ATPase FtsK/SpoIIIE
VIEVLRAFKFSGSISTVHHGPVVDTFDLELPPGARVASVVRLAPELALALRVPGVRVFPVAERGVVAVEVPHAHREHVDLPEAPGPGSLPLYLGVDTIGAPRWADLATLPHLLVAGTTGSGKTSALRAFVCTLLRAEYPPSILVVDPKGTEFSEFATTGAITVVSDVADALRALQGVEAEMDRRYRDGDLIARRLVVVIDELADLMLTSKKAAEAIIVRIAQKARGCGIHLICATQRPSVDVVTGLIKANFPALIAYQLRTATDSRVILCEAGAETLTGRGDGLYLAPGTGLRRIHAPRVTPADIERAIAWRVELDVAVDGWTVYAHSGARRVILHLRRTAEGLRPVVQREEVLGIDTTGLMDAVRRAVREQR